MLYKEKSVKSPEGGYELLKLFLADKDREHFIVVSLDTKNQPVSINICHISSLNANLVYPKEVVNPAIVA